MSDTEVLTRAAQAHAQAQEAEKLRIEALAQRQAAIREAHAAGMTYRQIAKHLGITWQRVQRSAQGNKPKHQRFVPVDL